MQKYYYTVKYSCPQCGAPVTLGELDKLLQCSFCRVRLYVTTSPHPIFVIHPAKNLTGKSLFYIPYWRFRGIVFRVKRRSISHKIADLTMRAVDSIKAPVSLGVRPQSVDLHVYNPSQDTLFVRPEMSSQEFLKNLSSSSPCEAHHLPDAETRLFVGETVSLVFFPFILKNDTLLDALTNKPVSPAHKADIETKLLPFKAPENWIRFRAAMCPHCGSDMEGAPDSIVGICKNCKSFWELGHSSFHKIPTYLVSVEAEKAGLWIPFWVLEFSSKNPDINTIGELFNLIGLPDYLAQNHGMRAACCIPAFRIAPRYFLRLSQIMTRIYPKIYLHKTDDNPPTDNNYYPPNLPAIEAFQSIPVLLASLCNKKDTPLNPFCKIPLTFMKKSLIFLPMEKIGSEWVQPRYSFGIPSSLILKWKI